jgi:hypothetical protein
MKRRIKMRLTLVVAAFTAVTVIQPAKAQDAQVTRSWVGIMGQRCHTLKVWREKAREWCDRYQEVKARREREQDFGWGTGYFSGTSRSADFNRDVQMEADYDSVCVGEQQGLVNAQRQADALNPAAPPPPDPRYQSVYKQNLDRPHVRL